MTFITQRLYHLAALLACMLAGAAAQAGVSLQGEADLVAALKANPPCCVIDARSDARRRELPLEDALPYRPGLRIVPTASVVVVADTDAQARKVGGVLAGRYPGKTILAVRGGDTAWAAVRKTLESVTASTAPGTGHSFIIPRNTCESGETLQVLKSAPRAEPMPRTAPPKP
jgi:hypothetical protein